MTAVAETKGKKAPKSEAVTVAIFATVMLIVLGAPWDTGSAVALLFTIAWSAGFGLLLYICVLQRRLLLTAIVFLFASAYAASLGDHVTDGVSRMGVAATVTSTRHAAALILMFMWITVLIAMRTADLLGSRPRPYRADLERFRASVVGGALWLLFGVTLVAAWNTGFWTNYGAERVGAAGGVRFELHYLQLIFALFVYRLSVFPWTGSWSRRAIEYAVFGGLTILIFFVQQRRLMLLCATLFMGHMLLAGRIKIGRGKTRVRRWATLIIPAMLGLGIFASAAWRSDRGPGTAFDKLRRTTTSFVTAPTVEQDALKERFTYLWLDATAIEHSDRMRPLSLLEQLKFEVAIATPAILYADKYRIPPETCENVMRPLGLQLDLPCTPTAEGYLAFGTLGVTLVAVFWGLFIGCATFLADHRKSMLRVMGVFAFATLIDIETGAIPFVMSMRLILMFGLPIALVGYVLGQLLYWRAPTKRARSARVGGVSVSTRP